MARRRGLRCLWPCAKWFSRPVVSAPKLDQLIQMREELRAIWTRTNVSAEQLVQDLRLGVSVLKPVALQPCKIFRARYAQRMPEP